MVTALTQADWSRAAARLDCATRALLVGGVRASGSGRDRSLHAVEHYSALRTTRIKW